MEIKIKITYIDLFENRVKAKIIKIFGWNELNNQIISYQIPENGIIKIEKILEPFNEDIEDLTIN